MNNSEEINQDKSNKSCDQSIGYFTRAKRRKLEKNYEECTVVFPNHQRKRKNPIAYMPMELLQAIFGFVSHHELSQSVRLVNHRFKIIAEDLLNTAYRDIGKKLNTHILTTEISLACTRDDIEIKCIAKLLNLLEILKFQYSMVISTVWRYIFNHFYKTTKTCFYAGKLIDEHYNFFYKFASCPNLLYGPSVIKDYSLPREVHKIIHLSKNFCLHFDKVNEELVAGCLLSSGCKMIDILDCAKYAHRIVVSESASKSSFRAKYSYFFGNSWFVALPVTATKDMEWNQRQRMMHMRLRRIVWAHNDMFLQQYQYGRENILRPNPIISRVRKPGNNVYTGYGDVGNMFFYYGVMNDGAYFQKFGQQRNDAVEDDDDELLDHNDENFNPQALNLIPINNLNDIYRIPYLGFRINIDIRCPISYAPLNYLNTLDENQIESLKNHPKTHGPMRITMAFECQGASYPRLPTNYEYDFNAKHL